MIDINKLYYRYKVNKKRSKNRRLEALADVSLNLKESDRTAIIGFNGSGKSTLMKLIMGILKPSSGTIIVGGLDPWKHRKRHVKNIGVVWGQRTNLWWDLPVIDSFKTLCKVYGVKDDIAKKRIADFDAMFDLHPFWQQPVRKLSLGQRVKAEITASLLHNPKMLILDEPFVGLDFIARELIIQSLNELIDREGSTLLLTSHNLQDLNDLCSKIVLLNEGKLVYSGALDAFTNPASYKDVVIQMKKEQHLKLDDNIMEKYAIKRRVSAEENECIFSLLNCEEVEEFISDVLAVNTNNVIGLTVKQPDIESAIIRFIEGNAIR